MCRFKNVLLWCHPVVVQPGPTITPTNNLLNLTSCLTWGWSSQWSGWCWVTDCCVSSADVLSVQTEPSDCGNKAGKTSLQNGYFLRAADYVQRYDKSDIWRRLLPDTDISTLFITYSHVHRWGSNCGKKEKTINIKQLSSYLACSVVW